MMSLVDVAMLWLEGCRGALGPRVVSRSGLPSNASVPQMEEQFVEVPVWVSRSKIQERTAWLSSISPR